MLHATIRGLALLAALTIAVPAARAEDWPEARGPNRDGTSSETGLPSRWSPAGENLAWKAPFGGRSAPVVLGNRVYVFDAVGTGDTAQERVVALDAATGKPSWEYRFNVSLSDVPAHRAAWSSPAVDPSTGNVYAFGVGGLLVALDTKGKPLWERSLTEEFGAITTHGGRTVSPVIDGDLLIVHALTAGWGDQARTGNRWFAFDKKTGENVWTSAPQARHYDTNYSIPIVADVGGRRLLIVGGTDGAIHALLVHTGQPVWKYEISKRAINTSVVLKGTTAYVTHSEENLDTSDMGLTAAIDAAATGTIGPEQIRWKTHGFQGGFASPVILGDRLYQVDNGGVLAAFDVASGRKLWDKNLGTIQKAPLVAADGKIYVGTENGRFFILRPTADGVEVLDDEALGTEAAPEAIIAPVAVAGGRVYLVTSDALYAIGPKAVRAAGKARGKPSVTSAAPPATAPGGTTAAVQVVPADVMLDPGEGARFHLRGFDDHGQALGSAKAQWSLDGLTGTVSPEGAFTPDAGAGAQAGTVKATVGSVAGAGRVRAVAPLPWSYDFEASAGEAPPRGWIGATGRYTVRDVTGTKALFRPLDSTVARRVRVFVGPADMANYTVQADVMTSEKRRQRGDVGVIAQRYTLMLFGNSQRIELQPWQANTGRTVATKFEWKPDTWYRLKLEVQGLPDGTARVRGKAWPAAEPEPAAWTVEKIDKIPHPHGSPGLYGDAASDIAFDNIRVTQNGAQGQ